MRVEGSRIWIRNKAYLSVLDLKRNKIYKMFKAAVEFDTTSPFTMDVSSDY